MSSKSRSNSTYTQKILQFITEIEFKSPSYYTVPILQFCGSVDLEAVAEERELDDLDGGGQREEELGLPWWGGRDAGALGPACRI